MTDACADSIPLLEPGTEIDQYVISQRIGEGACADVYKAKQVKLERDVAIKMLKKSDDWDSEVIALLEEEAKTIARLKHPNIINVIDCGEYEQSYYVVTEYVDGQTLRDTLAENTTSLSDRLNIIVNVLRALEYAHNNGVVHRDLKPANILISSDGFVKLLDFGVSLSLNERSDLTDSDLVVGTPAYMAPEQFRPGNKVDHRADIYSAGIILFEIITGKRPDIDPVHICELNEEFPRNLGDLIMRCLEEKPDERPRSISLLKNELLSYLGSKDTKKSRAISSNVKLDQNLISNCVFLDTLKESPFGATYLVKSRQDGSLYVIKKMLRTTQGVKVSRVLSSLTHPNLLEIYGAGANRDTGVIISKYAQGGALSNRLVKAYSIRDSLAIFKQIAAGLKFAHDNGIVHGNLRPSNVLFDESGSVKICDFALPEHYLRKRDNWYAAPEPEKTYSSDIYTTAVILHQLLTTRLPHFNSVGELGWIAKSEDKRFALLNLLSEMLERNPANRPKSFGEVLDKVEAFEKAHTEAQKGKKKKKEQKEENAVSN